MTRVFVDSSVLIAAAYSATGASREIIRWAIRGRITPVVSDLVLEETEKNLARKAPEALPAFRRFLDMVRGLDSLKQVTCRLRAGYGVSVTGLRFGVEEATPPQMGL
jgi:predicted nucleic acid-binding protein